MGENTSSAAGQSAEGQAPTASSENKTTLHSPTIGANGQHALTPNGGEKDAGKKVKSDKELEKERQKAEKRAKFEAKKTKTQDGPGTAPKVKDKKKTDDSGGDLAKKYIESTPKGEKKILQPLDDEFHKAYIPAVVESAWYDWWEKQDLLKPQFTADGKVREKGKFVIAIPPPNVTGALHCGHALGSALQDTLIRWHRMRGFTTLYIPGCDHAGIATQAIVEKMLARREKKTRHDLGRQMFVERCHTWKEEYHASINRVFRRMGVSVDWSREAFTMDVNLSAAVTETFVRLHDEGLIYRSNKLVNWSCRLSTALSQIEVDSKALTGSTKLDIPGYDKKIEFGTLTFFKYPIEGSDETIEVATTRPETMLGDTGIAVNPNDRRYTHFVGKNAVHPFIPGRKLPIVADDYVDIDFGTGAVKLTPAHDQNDFKLGKKHKLEFINLFTDDGLLNENGGPFTGHKRFDVRYEIIAELKAKGLYSKQESNPMNVPICSRSGDVVEPMMKPQWWMRMESLAKPAIEVVKTGELKIIPERQSRIYTHWMENIDDWCLSRQLWWGHQIPAYFITVEGVQGDDSMDDAWVTGRTEDEARLKAEKKFPGKKIELRRDDDVLDTWFSSGLWPFSTLGWPKNTADFERLYPTSVLETGWDIIFFWVARMIMFGLKLTGKVPFTEVYCHSLIRDSEGRKMSKSLGNVIDPVDILNGIGLDSLHEKLRAGNLDPKEIKNAEAYQRKAFPQGIPECGADALRFSLVQYTTGGGDINFDVKVMHAYRRFCNKIYQATKYVLGKLGNDFVPQPTNALTGKESLSEKWMLHKMNNAARDVNKALHEREFSRSTKFLYQYWYDELCDVYIENSKFIIQEGSPDEARSATDTLYSALEAGLTMIHPIMPFLSEELWQRLPRRPKDTTISISVAAYPEHDASFDDAESEVAYELALGCSKGIRSLCAEYSIKESGEAFVQALNTADHAIATEQAPAIRQLSGKAVSNLSILGPEDAKPPGCSIFTVSASAIVYLHVKGKINVDEEISKAQKKRDKANEKVLQQEKVLKSLEGGIVAEAVVEAEETKLRDAQAEVRAFDDAISQFEALKLEG